MANDTGPNCVADKGPVTRSSRETLSKKVAASASATPNRKSERLEKRSPSSPGGLVDPKRKTEKTEMPSPTPLRRSERTRKDCPSDPPASRSSGSGTRQKKRCTGKQLLFEASEDGDDEDEERGVEASSRPRTRRVTEHCHVKKTNGMNRSTEGDDGGGSKIDGYLRRNCLDSANDDKGIRLPEDATSKETRAEPKLSEPVKELSDDDVTVNPMVPSDTASCEPSGLPEKVQLDSCKEERSQNLGSSDFISNENLIRKRIEHDKDESSISSKRKRTTVAMHSDASTLLVDNDNNNNSNLFEDTRPSRICNNVVETSGSCSKRIRQLSLSDVKKDRKKSTNNVDQPSSKISTRDKEDSERPQMNTVETYKIRKQQRSIHLLLKPEIANLCEILHLPDNVKSMVQNCLEYTMNNYQICTEPLPILQAFQLSLCLTAAALLNHKLNFEASLLLAKQHLNFDCKKEIVDEINSRLWDLKEKFLSLKGNSNVAGCAKASESSSGAYSYTEVTPEAELVKTDNSVNTKTVQKRKSQWNKLLLMQREEKIKLKKDIENENAEIQRRHQIEWEAIQSCSPGNLTNDGKLQASKSSYMKRTRELNRQQEIRLKDLEVKQLKARLMFQESSAPDELLNPIASNKVGTMVKSLQICDQAQHHNAPKVLVSDHVAEEKGFNDTVEVKERIESGVGSSEAPDANASVVAPFSSTVELQTRLVKNADDEMDIVASKDGLVSEIKCSNIVENEYESLGNIISKHTKSREHRSDGVIRVLDGEECVNINHESHNDFGQNAIQVLPSYNEDIRHGETLDVLSAEVAPLVCNTSSSENDLVEIPSRQGELNGTIQIKPVCGPSIEVAANGSNDGEKNMTLLNSQSSEEHIPSVNTMCTPYCENTAQIHDADNNYGSNNADTLNSSLYDERISSVNSKSPQDRIHNENDKHTLDCETFALNGSGSDNFILNSPLVDERNADRTIVLNRDAHGGIHVAVNLTSSTKEISRGAVNDSVLSSVLSKPCGADSSSNNSSDANAILSNQTSIEKQNHDGVSSSIPVRQVPVGVSETNESAIVNVLDAEEASWMPDAVNYPDNVIPQNSSSMDQLANGGPVFDDNLSSETCTTSPSNSRALPDEHVSVLMPENSLGEVEFQLTHNVVIDKSATLDQQEGVCTTMTENSSYQETPVSRPVDFMESLEQVQSLSFVESPPHLDTTRETQNYVVSSVVDVVQANQSINDSLVMEPPQEGQFPSADFFSSDWDLSNLPLVTRTEDQSYNEDDLLDHIPGTLIEIQNQSFVQHPSNSDQQEGVCRTMIGNSLSQETPVSLSVDDLMEPLEQVQPLSSLESPPDQNTTIEMQNSLVSSSVDTVPANVSTNDSLVMEPPGKEGQLPSASILSSNDGDPSNLPTVTGTENQPSNENDLPNHVPETSIEIQDQVVQCTSNVELDSSCLRQDVHPASNMDLVSHVVAVVRQQSSNTRNLSTLTEINNHPIQPASQSDSRIIQRLALDPLKCEMERLHRLVEDNKKDFEERKLKLKQDFEKDLEELYRKFDIKHKENEVEVQKIRKDLDRQHSIVNVNMKLAEACRVKSMNFLLSGSPSMHKDASPVQQLFQVASPQNATAPNVVARPSSREYSAASLQSSYATTTSQTMVPPIQATYSSPGTFSVTPSRLPRINPLTSLLGNVQTGGEIRAPAPHLHPYRAPTPVPASTFCTVLRGRPSQPAPGNIHVTSPPFSYQTPRPAPATFPPVLHGGLWPPTLPVINPHTEPNSQHGTYLPNVRPHMPDLPSMNLSKCDKSSITTATSAHPATSSDVVCLSDDE